MDGACCIHEQEESRGERTTLKQENLQGWDVRMGSEIKAYVLVMLNLHCQLFILMGLLSQQFNI